MIKNRKLKLNFFSTFGVKGKIMLLTSMVIILAVVTTVGPIMYMQSERLFTTYREKTDVAALALTEAFAENKKQTYLATKAVAFTPGLAEAIEARDTQMCLRILRPRAVVAMEEGTREVRIGAEVVNETRCAFQDIYRSINEVSNQMQEISAAIQQMTGGSQQVVASIREIDTISKDAAGQAQTVSAATEEQSAAMEEITASSQALAKMAEKLTQAVSKFKI